MASAFNVSQLSEYVKANTDELITNAAVGAKTLDYVEVMTDVKYKDALIYLDSEVVLADGESCSFNPQGSDAYAEKFIEVKPVKIEKEWCARDLRKSALQHELRFSANREKLPFADTLAWSNVEATKVAVDNLVWKGDSSLGITGFVDRITALDHSVAKQDTITATIDALYAALPIKAVAKGIDIFVSYTTFRQYVAEQNAYCCNNRPMVDAAADSMEYVGDSRVQIIPVIGLEGANVIVAASRKNLVYGTDIEGSESEFKMWEENDGMFRMRILFNAGTQIKFDDEAYYVAL